MTDIDELKDFIRQAIDDHATESRNGIELTQEHIKAAHDAAYRNEETLKELNTTLSGIRKDSEVRTVQLNTRLDGIDNALTETRDDVKQLINSDGQQEARIKLLEKGENIPGPSWISGKYVPTILALTVLTFVVGMFDLAGFHIYDLVKIWFDN